MVNVGIIGAGYWGKNLIRNFNELKDATILKVCDSDKSKLENIISNKQYTGITGTTNADDIFTDKKIDAVVIATQTNTHFELAKNALLKGKHVFVEKPLTYDPVESLCLTDIAEQSDKKLMVGHIFLYNNAVKYMKDNIKDIGDIRYFHAQRNGLGPIRNDCNAMWDLTPHDISMFNYLTDSKPTHVIANGKTYVQKDKGIEDAVSLSLDYPNNVMANVNASWIDPVKTRKMTVVGDKKMIVFDDMSSDKITVYNKGVDYQPKTGDFSAFQMSFRDGDIIKPKINYNEPLKDECQAFIDSIKTGEDSITNGKNGYEVVAVLDAAQRSLKSGQKEEIKYYDI